MMEVVEKITTIRTNIEKIAKEPAEKKTIESLEAQIKDSFDWLKEGKTRFLFTVSSMQYKKGDIDINRYKNILSWNIKNEIERGLILFVLKNFAPMTPQLISKEGNIPTTRMFQHIVSLLRDGEIAIAGESEDSIIISPIPKKERGQAVDQRDYE